MSYNSYGAKIRGTTSKFFEKYGLAFVMVASYFGSGSVFIASQAGVQFGYLLVWAVVGAVFIGFIGQDMSARLGIFGVPLMTFARRKLGTGGATVLAAILSVGCVAWALELTAAVGTGISILLGGVVGWQPLAVLSGALAIVVGIQNYDGVERIMTAMMIALLAIYVTVAGVSSPSLSSIAAGFVPSLPGGSLTLAAAIIGTTALWPNFFLESNLVEEKGWTSAADLPSVRRDLGIGYLVGGATTVAIIVVAAAILRPAGYTSLETFITPGRALAEVLGDWAMVMFLLGTVAAAFNSIVPIMWTPAYLFQHARGRTADPGSREFKLIYAVGVAIGSLSPLVNEFAGLSVIDMIILFPAYNGIVSLPIAAVLLFWAVNDRETMGEHKNSLRMALVNASLVLLSIYLAATSLPGFVETVTSGGF
ncbi:NRAMP family divalent metal transporter [Haloprofundus salinisoli]|uniref:NRAMP family divalent metal transporter n=1 Tax=Haloprofundus salinisoli TaxID=2876193 RepID=UPI001CCBCC09|nr:divalent metal cation transporter [Haloprofundus salinisoli]